MPFLSHLPVARARTLVHGAVLACVIAAYLATQGTAATSTSVVSAVVPSATSLTNQCRNRAAYDLGLVVPGTPATTTTGASVCRIAFGSSNDTSSLRIVQEDAAGTAMRGIGWDRTPSGVSVKDIDSSGSTTWSAHSFGDLRRSSDGGATWTPVSSGTTDHLDGIAVASPTHVVAVGAGGRILRTTDGGVTWIPQTSGTTQDLKDVYAASPTVFIAVGAGDTIRRLDTAVSSGTWTTITPPSSGLIASAVDFVPGSTTVGFMLHGNQILRTTDAGLTWIHRHTLAGPGNFIDLDVADADNVWVVGDNGAIRHSSDGGLTFAVQTSIETGMIWEVSATTPDAVYAVAWSGRLLRTTDRGATWDAVANPATTALLGLDARGLDRVIAGGDNDLLRMKAITPIPDFSTGSQTWTVGTGMFGACLQAITGATADWTVDTGNTSGRCEPLDGDPWTAVPTTSSTIAHTTLAGQSASADLVFGFRAPPTTTPGAYTAPITFEVVAPA